MNIQSLPLRHLLAAAIIGLGTFAATALPSPAQMMGNPYDTMCGTYQGGTWSPNGNCPGYDYHHAGRLHGVIVNVNGHHVTLQTRDRGTIVVNDRPALMREDSGRVAVGRHVVARGYWNGSMFFVTSFE